MFQTEKLANLLDQLQNGRDLGYFATLSLILQIIGYFLVPILCIALFFVTNAFREPIFTMEKEFSRIPDCMCLDSGSGLCHYEEAGNIVDICVSGCVDVRYEGNKYLHFSEMPEKLQKMFHDGSAYNDPNIYIEESNWYELSFNDGYETRDVSYLQGYTSEQLKDFCHRFVIRHKI